jgi:hypothetical protein
MDEKFLEDALPEFDTICCGCGFALHRVEIAADINGGFTDFESKIHGEVSVCFCGECWIKFRELVDTEMPAAIARRRALENTDKADRGEVFRLDNNTDNVDIEGKIDENMQD